MRWIKLFGVNSSCQRMDVRPGLCQRRQHLFDRFPIPILDIFLSYVVWSVKHGLFLIPRNSFHDLSLPPWEVYIDLFPNGNGTIHRDRKSKGKVGLFDLLANVLELLFGNLERFDNA